MSYSKYKTVNFGPAKTGLATVGYSVMGTRLTTGVTELAVGSGCYGALVTFPDAFSGAVLWDTGGATPVWAVADEDASASAGGLTPPQIAGAVWDALLTDHVTAGSFGLSNGLDDSLDSGFAQAGTTTTITLRAGAPTALPSPATISIYAGTGKGQALAVLSYVGPTKVATMSGTWNTAPDLTTQYAVYSVPASGGGGGGVVTLNPAQTGWTFRDVTNVPDASLTLSDLLAGAMAAGTGKLVGAAGSTTFTAKTPYSGTLLKTHTLDAAPASGPYTRN